MGILIDLGAMDGFVLRTVEPLTGMTSRTLRPCPLDRADRLADRGVHRRWLISVVSCSIRRSADIADAGA